MDNVEFVPSGESAAYVAIDEDGWASDVQRMSNLTDGEMAYFMRWAQGYDEDAPLRTMFDMLIEDLVDGEC